MNSIIVVDDDREFINSFTNELAAKGIMVSPKNSLDGLKTLLPALAHKYAAVVLDIKCLLADDQAKEASSFIGAALKYLDTNVPGFPRLILTGDESEFNGLKNFYPDEKMYLKKPDQQVALIQELEYFISNAVPLRIRRENRLVFEVFESGKMNNASELQLIRILATGLQENDFGKFKGILADIRSFQEAIYKSINDRNKAVVPDNMFRPNGMIKFNDLMKHLCGGAIPPQPSSNTIYQVQTIYQLANSLYWSCGEYIHEDPHRTYFISEYAIRALINNLLELTIWSKLY